MILRLLLFSLLFPLGLCAQCTYSLQAQGNVHWGSSELVCYGLHTQININNIFGTGPYICILQDSTSSQLLQQDTVSAIFHNFTPVGAGTYSITVTDSLGVVRSILKLLSRIACMLL